MSEDSLRQRRWRKSGARARKEAGNNTTRPPKFGVPSSIPTTSVPSQSPPLTLPSGLLSLPQLCAGGRIHHSICIHWLLRAAHLPAARPLAHWPMFATATIPAVFHAPLDLCSDHRKRPQNREAASPSARSDRDHTSLSPISPCFSCQSIYRNRFMCPC